MSEANNQDKPEKQRKWTKKTTIKAIVTAVIIALLIISIVVFVRKNDANAQLKQFTNSINHNDPDRLATILSTNKRDMTTSEAKHLIAYFKQKDNAHRLNKQIKTIKGNIKADRATSELGTVKDKHNQPILDFSKNGKKMFFLGKLSIVPHYRSVYIKEADNTATYKLDKDHQVAVDKNKLNKLGTFVVGDYDMPAEKEFKEGAVKGNADGTLHVNTDNLDKNKRVVAKQAFNQTKIKIALHNDDKLDNKNRKLIINDKAMDLDTNKAYGYFPNSDSFSVQAEGQYKDQDFKTNTVNVLQGTTENSTQVVNLNFDDKAIDKAVKKEEKDKSKMSRFIKKYMDSLNKAYKHTDYDKIKDYIKKGSSADKFMKPKFKQKQDIKYTNTKVQSVKKDDDTYNIVISKQYKDNTINTKYEVQDGEITKIEDIQ